MRLGYGAVELICEGCDEEDEDDEEDEEDAYFMQCTMNDGEAVKR